MTIVNGYAALADLKARLNLTSSDATRDAALERQITAASRAIDRHCGRRFYLDSVATTRVYRTPVDTLELAVDDIGDATGVAVATDEDGDGAFETAWLASDFYLGPLNADKGLPDVRPFTRVICSSTVRPFRRLWGSSTRPTVQVTAKFGWPGAAVAGGVAAAPADVVEATLLKAARLARRKDSPEGVAGSSDTGVVRISKYEDPDVVLLLADLVRFDGPSGMAGIG